MMCEENQRPNGVETYFQKTFGCWGSIDASHQSEPQLCMPADSMYVKY